MPPPEQPVALVVGGSSGIGLASAAALLERGYRVHVGGREAARLASAREAVAGLSTHRADAGDAAAIAALAARIGPIDALVVAAGGSGGLGPLTELDLTALRAAFEAKFFAQLTTLQTVLPQLGATASITLVGAIAAHAAMPGSAGIGAVNAAVEALVRPLAVELAPRRVNAVSPGLVDTPWWAGFPTTQREAYFAHAASVLPSRQIATAAQVAEAIVLLATNRNLTGTVLEADGGARLVSV